MNALDTRNLNLLWAHLVLRELARAGVDTVFVSPGHRNGAIIAALTRFPEMRKKDLWDERAAAYQALGYAKATGKPGVLCCTSGTAACNYLPAVAEAAKDQIPLIIISADRPFELVHSGANQVLDQRNIFGAFAKRHVTLEAPNEQMRAGVVLDHARWLISEALSFPPGPVHLNMAFREPLGPQEAPISRVYVEDALRAVERAEGLTLSPVEAAVPASASLEKIAALITSAKRGLLLVGRLGFGVDRAPIAQLAEKLGWPLYEDIAANAGLRAGARTLFDPEASKVREGLLDYAPDVVLQVGKRLTTKWFDAIRGLRPPRHFISVSSEVDVQDPCHQQAHLLKGREDHIVARLNAVLSHLPSTADAAALTARASAWRAHVQREVADAPFGFAALAADTMHALPESSLLFLGNSMTVRAFDTFAVAGASQNALIAVNRGASGIEGQLSTAIGMGEALGRPVITVMGDVSLMHDLNAVLELRRTTVPVLLVVANNHEGGIFRRLPIAAHEQVLNPLMLTPHDMRFEGIATMAGVPYRLVTDRSAYRDTLQECVNAGRSAVLECAFATARDLQFIKSTYEGLQS